VQSIKDYPRYYINRAGVIYSERSKKELKHVINTHGYAQVRLNGTIKKVHILLAQAFIPNPENHPVVRHLNDIKTDNRLENLAWGTYKDNTQDMIKNGKQKIKRRFTEEEAIEIFISEKATEFFVKLHQVSRQTINKIRTRKTYEEFTATLQPNKRQGRTKLSLADQDKVLRDTRMYRVISKEFGISTATISNIKNGKGPYERTSK